MSANADIVERVSATARANGLDAIIVMSPQNFAYVAGFELPSQPTLRRRHAMLVVEADGQLSGFSAEREAALLSAQLGDIAITRWSEHADSPIDVLAGQLWDLALGSGRIGIEADFLPAGDLVALGNALPRAEFVAADDLLAEARMIKTPRELDLLRALSRLAEASIAPALDLVAAGVAERQIAAELARHAYLQGAGRIELLTVASGERSALEIAGIGARSIGEGDICRLGAMPVVAGYHAAIARTRAAGRLPARAERLMDSLADAREEVISTIRPGASSHALHRLFVRKAGALDIPQIASIGHGIGLDAHEGPHLAGDRDHVLEAGMVLAIGPLIALPSDGFGLQTTDMIAIGEAGAERLTGLAPR